MTLTCICILVLNCVYTIFYVPFFVVTKRNILIR